MSKFISNKKPIYLILSLMIFLLGCEPLDIKRVMDTRTDDIEISGTSVIAHGTILDIGKNPIVSYGHCWSTQPDPTIENFYTDLGTRAEAGDFESQLRGLIPGKIHYIKTYLFDGQNYIYGEEKSFEISAQDLEFSSDEPEEEEIGKILVSSSTNGIGSVNFSNHGHCWSQTDPPTVNDNKTAFGVFEQDTSFTSQLNNLKMGKYFIRGYLEAEGTIIYTNTVEYESVISVECVDVSLNGDGTVSMRGKINSLGTKPILDYGHCWSPIKNEPTRTIEDWDHYSSFSSFGAISVLGSYNSRTEILLPDKKYFVRAYAFDGSNYYYSQVKTIVTN